MIRADELTEIVEAYNPDSDSALLKRAYVYGAKMHSKQTRADGSSYFGHPVQVAGILTELKLDDATIATALLHDTLEDTDATYDDLVNLFGEDVAVLVQGVTKLSKLEKRSFEEAQADNFRKLLLATAKDVRVILVKLADRLHNMRTIKNLRPEKQERIARETLEIFAPMAGRMGMQSMRDELEDIVFEVLQPKARRSIMHRFIKLRNQHGEAQIPIIADDIRDFLKEKGIDSHVSGREKRPYSIWKKIQDKDISFEQLSDIIGFRVVVPKVVNCYEALGHIHTRWPTVPGYFKDYISVPKANGYRSIHTMIMNDKGQRLEIQIRTVDMDEVAETGVAAHWRYKDGTRAQNRFAVDPFSWVKTFVERATHGDSDEDFLENAKLDMFQDQIFCFTPRGRVIEIPRGATALDFAYEVHSRIGDTCVGAKIDGTRVPLWSALRNGQTIEIIRSDSQKPTENWLDIVITGRAKAAIKRALKAQMQEHYVKLGRDLVNHVFVKVDKELTEHTLAVAAQRLAYNDTNKLMLGVGRKAISGRDVLEAVYPGMRVYSSQKVATAPMLPLQKRVRVRQTNRTGGQRRNNALYSIRRIAACCQPVPGERIVGIIGDSGGLSIHAIACDALVSMEDDPDRWIDVRWEDTGKDRFLHLSTLQVVIINKPGALGVITSLIGEMGSNIFNLSMQTRMNDFYALNIAIEVFDIRHLSNIVSAIEAQSVVHSVERVRADTASEEIMHMYAKYNMSSDVAVGSTIQQETGLL